MNILLSIDYILCSTIQMINCEYVYALANCYKFAAGLVSRHQSRLTMNAIIFTLLCWTCIVSVAVGNSVHQSAIDIEDAPYMASIRMTSTKDGQETTENLIGVIISRKFILTSPRP